MSCPFLHTDHDGGICRRPGNELSARRRRSVLWVCEKEWKRYCPLYFEKRLLAERSVVPEEDDAFENYHIAHYNRLGGHRTVAAEFV